MEGQTERTPRGSSARCLGSFVATEGIETIWHLRGRTCTDEINGVSQALNALVFFASLPGHKLELLPTHWYTL